MGKRLPNTPRSKVRNALRQLFLRSRERSSALRREKNTCQHCHIKASVAKGREQKVQVHHKSGIGNWEAVIDAVYAEILCSPDMMDVLCPECHSEEHEREKVHDLAEKIL
jgi:hypothetical protein